jgi:hypothetical protein
MDEQALQRARAPAAAARPAGMTAMREE